MANNSIGDSGTIELLQAILASPHVRNFTLDLANNGISDEAVMKVASFLEHTIEVSPLQRLFHLDLSFNHITMTAAYPFVRAVTKRSPFESKLEIIAYMNGNMLTPEECMQLTEIQTIDERQVIFSMHDHYENTILVSPIHRSPIVRHQAKAIPRKAIDVFDIADTLEEIEVENGKQEKKHTEDDEQIPSFVLKLEDKPEKVDQIVERFAVEPLPILNVVPPVTKTNEKEIAPKEILLNLVVEEPVKPIPAPAPEAALLNALSYSERRRRVAEPTKDPESALVTLFQKKKVSFQEQPVLVIEEDAITANMPLPTLVATMPVQPTPSLQASQFNAPILPAKMEPPVLPSRPLMVESAAKDDDSTSIASAAEARRDDDVLAHTFSQSSLLVVGDNPLSNLVNSGYAKFKADRLQAGSLDKKKVTLELFKLRLVIKQKQLFGSPKILFDMLWSEITDIAEYDHGIIQFNTNTLVSVITLTCRKNAKNLFAAAKAFKAAHQAPSID